MFFGEPKMGLQWHRCGNPHLDVLFLRNWLGKKN